MAADPRHLGPHPYPELSFLYISLFYENSFNINSIAISVLFLLCVKILYVVSCLVVVVTFTQKQFIVKSFFLNHFFRRKESQVRGDNQTTTTMLLTLWLFCSFFLLVRKKLFFSANTEIILSLCDKYTDKAPNLQLTQRLEILLEKRVFLTFSLFLYFHKFRLINNDARYSARWFGAMIRHAFYLIYSARIKF